MKALIWIAVFFIYFIIEFVISMLFTYKIAFVSKDNYNKAAFFGATSTFLFMFSTLIAAYVMNQSTFIDNWFFSSPLLFLFWTTISLTIGNFCATIIIPKINKILLNRKNSNKEKESEIE